MRREHPPLAEASLPKIRNVLRAAQPPKRGDGGAANNRALTLRYRRAIRHPARQTV